MIFIIVRWKIRPKKADEWLSIVDPFTQATRAEPGNLFFDWSRSVDDRNEFVLVEAFRDGAAGAAHVQSDHFMAAQRDLPEALAATPEVINVEIPDKSGWDQLAEIQPR
jgi:quinol monooxygenase YgiN